MAGFFSRKLFSEPSSGCLPPSVPDIRSSTSPVDVLWSRRRFPIELPRPSPPSPPRQRFPIELPRPSPPSPPRRRFPIELPRPSPPSPPRRRFPIELPRPSTPSPPSRRRPVETSSELSSLASSESSSSDEEEARRLQEQLRKQQEEVRRLRGAMRKLEVSVDQAQSQDRQTVVAELARATAATQNSGVNIGIFGQTSTGKSTVVNGLLGQTVAATGAGETTTEMTPYRGTNYTLWDAPGRNDELNYRNRSFIASLKGLTRRLILVQSTLRENTELMRLLDRLELDYDIVVNKLDDVPSIERASFQTQIRGEARSLRLTHMRGLFFVSAKFPAMFPDWLRMADSLANTVLG